MKKALMILIVITTIILLVTSGMAKNDYSISCEEISQ